MTQELPNLFEPLIPFEKESVDHNTIAINANSSSSSKVEVCLFCFICLFVSLLYIYIYIILNIYRHSRIFKLYVC